MASSGTRKHSEKRSSKQAAARQNTLIPATTTTEGGLVARDPVHMLSSLVDHLQTSDQTEKKALEIYGRIQTQKLVRGRSIPALAAASLYAACRNTGSTSTLKEISKASGIDIRAIARIYRLLLNELDLKVTVTDPAMCVSIVAEKAGLRDEDTTAQALKIFKDRGVAPSLAGKDPMGLAATALYMACVRNGKAEKSQKEIAQAAGVTEVTIRNRYKELKSVIEEKALLNASAVNPEASTQTLNDWLISSS
jgi:transcription initiation factor TFIIB